MTALATPPGAQDQSVLQTESIEGWATAPLAELVTDAIGGAWGDAPESTDAGAKLARVIRGTEFRNWDRERGATAAIRAIRAKSLERRLLRDGAIVVEVSGGGPSQPVGRSLLIDQKVLSTSELPLTCSNFCRKVEIASQMDAAYVQKALHYAYQSGVLDEFQTASTNIRNLNFGDMLANVRIPIPPLAEQRRIVERVDELLAQVDAVRERLARVSTLLKRFRQSVLDAAVSGRLTEGWRESHPDLEAAAVVLNDIASQLPRSGRQKPTPPEAATPDLPDGWQWVSPSQIVSSDEYSLAIGPFGSNLKVSDYRDHGVPLVFVRNIRSRRFGEDGQKFVSPSKATELKAHTVEAGDILVTKMGDPPGDVARYPAGAPRAVITADCIKFRPSNTICSDYIVTALASELVRSQVRDLTIGVAQQKISLERFRTIGLPFPPVAEQAEIFRRVSGLFSASEAADAGLRDALDRVAPLTNAILTAAFRGELVPTEAELARQDGRDYESGEQLLARIKSERPAPLKRGRKATR